MIQKITIACMLIIMGDCACNGQKNNPTMNNQIRNPLLCDLETGLCDMPDAAAAPDKLAIPSAEKRVQILYFTDPICSSCWGIEPALRKLKLEYGDCIDIDYRMGGLLPDWSYNSGGISKPSDVAHHWDEVSLHYDMPIDGDVWLEDPLPSSFPPSIAFKAAQIQDKAKAILFLRRIREMVFLEKKNITKWEHIGTAAMAVGLDTAQLKTDFEGKARELFQQDLDLGRKLGVRGFPTLFFSDDLNAQVKVYGVKPYAVFEQAVLQLKPTAVKKTIDVPGLSLFEKYNSLTSREFAELSGRSKSESEAFLQNLVNENKLSKFVTKNGVLWFK